MNEKISDQKIVRHYLDRLKSAILETKNKYGKLINLIAYNILCSKDDADECENDTYLNVWNSIPPNEPENLKAYCLRISRNLAIKRYRYNLAQKRDNSKQLSLEKIMEECGDIFPEQSNVTNYKRKIIMLIVMITISWSYVMIPKFVYAEDKLMPYREVLIEMNNKLGTDYSFLEGTRGECNIKCVSYR